jgi:hypothetical protein
MTTTRNPIPGESTSSYTDGVNTQCWMYAENLTQSSPNVVEMSFIANAAAVGATTVTLLIPISRPLSRLYRVTNGTQCFELTADAPAGATTLTVVPLLSAIAANTAFLAIPMIPFYSTAENGAKSTADTTTIRNYGASVNKINKPHAYSAEMTLKGFVTKGDTALKIIRAGSRGAGNIYVRVIEPDEEAIEGYWEVTSADVGSQVDKDYENSFTLMAASAITYPSYALA